jgi:hypothetical protein
LQRGDKSSGSPNSLSPNDNSVRPRQLLSSALSLGSSAVSIDRLSLEMCRAWVISKKYISENAHGTASSHLPNPKSTSPRQGSVAMLQKSGSSNLGSESFNLGSAQGLGSAPVLGPPQALGPPHVSPVQLGMPQASVSRRCRKSEVVSFRSWLLSEADVGDGELSGEELQWFLESLVEKAEAEKGDPSQSDAGSQSEFAVESHSEFAVESHSDAGSPIREILKNQDLIVKDQGADHRRGMVGTWPAAVQLRIIDLAMQRMNESGK